MDIDEAIQLAIRHHQAGNLQQAENVYKEILKSHPNNFYALQYLGVLNIQYGKYDSAIEYIEKALQANPNDSHAYYNYGIALGAKGQIDEALNCYQKAIQLNPNNSDAYANLGIIYKVKGQLDKAISTFEKAIQLNPNLFTAYYSLGLTYHEKGLLDNAIDYYLRALQMNNNLPDLCYQLGLAFQEKEQFNFAIDYYQKAIQLNPNHYAAYNNLGIILKEHGSIKEAITSYNKAMQINPNVAFIHNNLGDAFYQKGNIEDAIDSYERALQIDPTLTSAYNNLGNAFAKRGEFDKAIIYYEKATLSSRNAFEAYNNLGIALYHKGQLHEAISHFERALSINQNYSNAYTSLAMALKDKALYDEAEKHLRHALQLNPNSSDTYSNLLFYMNYNPRYTSRDIFIEHLHFQELFAQPLYSKQLPHSNDRSISRRLKIGYVSPDFRKHSVAYFIESVLREHNREGFEVFCYSDVVNRDSVTQRIQECSDQWHIIVGISDDVVTELIHKDQIDILIDLTGHTGSNRMLLFARRPAPIQITWVGYPATTGLSTIDYKIIDRYTDPPGVTEQEYTEELLRLSESFLCYLPDPDSPTVSILPRLTSGHITFGSLNNVAKISTEIVTLWAQILKKVPHSRLILKSKNFSDTRACDYLIDMFIRKGIVAESIELLLAEPSTRGHLNVYNRIDIGLDTFPYHGTTTTCEAMWMGVPIITLRGNTYASRVGGSLLSNIGLSELIATTGNDYIEIAVHLANDLGRLQLLRERLRYMMKSSPLCDAKKFTANLEMCYRQMWEKWCKSVK